MFWPVQPRLKLVPAYPQERDARLRGAGQQVVLEFGANVRKTLLHNPGRTIAARTQALYLQPQLLAVHSVSVAFGRANLRTVVNTVASRHRRAALRAAAESAAGEKSVVRCFVTVDLLELVQ